MTLKEQLIQELEQTSDELIAEILDFCHILKQRELDNSPSQREKSGMADLLASVQEIQKSVPSEVWEQLPKDGSINHDHYLYGSPKVET